jgi:hypothetical protein
VRTWCVLLIVTACTAQRNIGVQECSEGVAACTAPDGPVHSYSTVQEFESLVLGRWLTCSGPGMPGWASDQVGVELTADGHFYVLHRDASGAIARGQGVQYEGTWTTPSTDPLTYAQLNVVHADGGFNPWNPVFEDNPRKMGITGQLPSGMPFSSVYVLVCDAGGNGDGGSGGTDGSSGAMCGAPACSSAEGPVHSWQTQSELEGLLEKRWALCTSQGIVGWASDEAGIELAPGGLFFILHPDASGNLVRGQGASYEGTWTLDVSSGFAHLNIVHADGGLIPANLSLEDTPSKLFFVLDAPGAFDRPTYVVDCMP